MRIYTMLTGLMETNCYLVVTKERHIATIPALWRPSASATPIAR